MIACGPGSHSRASVHMVIPETINTSQMNAPGAILQGSTEPSAAPVTQEAGG